MHKPTGVRGWILAGMGLIMLLGGIGAAFLGPLEIYPFYLFSEGGRFYYDGFGFGSFMFGNIAAQVLGYYILAAVLIPLGFGHLRLRRWSRTLMVAIVWCWLVAGAPLAVVFLFTLFSVKQLSLVAGWAVVAAVGLSYAVVPWLLLRFYNGPKVRRVFAEADRSTYWTERLPMPVLVLVLLMALYAVILHVPILFNGLFPVFGSWLSGLQGIIALDISILSMVALAWGTTGRRMWAWWADLIFFALLTASSVVTLVRSTYAEILTLMQFPPFEMDMLQGMPLRGFHFAIFVGIPLVITLGVIISARSHFRIEASAPEQAAEAT